VRLRCSNLGFGLLGHVLARRVTTSYDKLVRDRFCAPLDLADSQGSSGCENRSTPLPPIFLPSGAGEMLDYGDGDISIVLAAGEATGKAFSVAEHRPRSGKGRPFTDTSAYVMRSTSSKGR
jgi:CubicO group peptidase (beta-lactamase class C family)